MNNPGLEIRGDCISAIDPGPTESAIVVIDKGYHPRFFAKDRNEVVLQYINGMRNGISDIVIEMVASYGMPVGAEVFETCVWIGRFMEHAHRQGLAVRRVVRQDEKLCVCHSPKANDATIRNGLIYRFAPNLKGTGKGTKKHPGWFYGFKEDIWAAYAVGVTYLDIVAGLYAPTETSRRYLSIMEEGNNGTT